MKPSGIAVLRVSLCASNKYNLFCLFILYQALITKSLNSFSVNHNVTYCSTLPVLLPDVQSEHGMVSRIHSSVQSYGRTLQMKDRRRARPDTALKVCLCGASLLNSHLNQLSNAFLIQPCKWVRLVNLSLVVGIQELAGIVT